MKRYRPPRARAPQQHRPRAEAIQALSPIAAEQGGLLSTAQVRLAGVDRHLVAELAGGGYLQHLRRGVYAFGFGMPDRFEDIAGAWLAVDGRRLPWERTDAPEAVVSHASAAQLHSIGTIIPTLPELTEHGSAPAEATSSSMSLDSPPRTGSGSGLAPGCVCR